MNKLMPYFRLMKKSIILIIVITLSIVITNDGKEILTGFKHSVFENVHLIFNSGIYSTTVLLIFIYGIYLSYKKFNVAINIKADRKSYIKASIISMIGIGVVFSIFTVLWSLILKFVVEAVSGKNALVVGDSVYFIGTITDLINSLPGMGVAIFFSFDKLSVARFIIDIFGQFLTLLSCSSIGFLLGSILYRLKKKTLIIIFLVIPTVVVTLGVIFSIFNTDLLMSYIATNLGIILIFITNVNIGLIIKILTITISLISSVLLLKNAPIKEYAHDLI